MNTFRAKNWFNVITLIIAAVALLVSLEGNQIALDSAKSQVEVIRDEKQYGISPATAASTTS